MSMFYETNSGMNEYVLRNYSSSGVNEYILRN